MAENRMNRDSEYRQGYRSGHNDGFIEAYLDGSMEMLETLKKELDGFKDKVLYVKKYDKILSVGTLIDMHIEELKKEKEDW